MKFLAQYTQLWHHVNNKYGVEEDAKKQSKFPLSVQTNAITSLQDGFSSRNVSHMQELKSSEKLSPNFQPVLLLFYATYSRNGQRAVENMAKWNCTIMYERQRKRVGKLPPKQGQGHLLRHQPSKRRCPLSPLDRN